MRQMEKNESSVLLRLPGLQGCRQMGKQEQTQVLEEFSVKVLLNS